MLNTDFTNAGGVQALVAILLSVDAYEKYIRRI